MLLLTATALAADVGVLLIGNSYTQQNDLAAVLDGDLETGAYESAEVVALTKGGRTLEGHLEDAETEGSAWHEELGKTGTYDFVVLQDQSQVPGFPQSNATWRASKQAAADLDALIEAHGAETVLMLTWGRRDGDAQNPERYPDFQTMQDLLTEGYLAYAEGIERRVTVAPVGHAFAWVHDHAPDRFEGLYRSDGSHPSAEGTALASLVLYAALTGRDATHEDPTLAQAANAAVEPFGDIPYLWAMELDELEGDTLGDHGPVRPHLLIRDSTDRDLVLADAVVHVESETTATLTGTGDVEVLAPSYRVTQPAQIDVEGSVTLDELVVELEESATIVCATTLTLDAVVLPEGAYTQQDGDCLELVFGEEPPTADDPADPEGCGQFAVALLFPLGLRRRCC